jgi:hypothetical protein
VILAPRGSLHIYPEQLYSQTAHPPGVSRAD